MDTNLDTLIGFTIPARHARGRVARLGPVLDEVLAAHGYPPAVEKVLAEALTLTALLGSTLKNDDGQMTLQAQTEKGVIDLLVCDYRGGAVRGYLKFDAERLAEMPADPTLFALFGKGYLAITFDQAESGERYQGIVPLEGASLGEAAQNYFCQSEQIPSFVRIATMHGPDGCRAGGILIQHLPEGEEGRERLHVRLDHPEWDHVRALGETIADAELVDPALALDDLVWRLFHEEDEVRIIPSAPIAKGCRCNAAHIADVIGRFPEDERRAMADDQGIISVDCAFCARVFPMPLTLVQN
ncbi:Hsp33 family molecular chaperone HslO [Sphingobium boeckii]|uniref:Molecular chaperone Hsp33 n=1 Tax=Sphingobium boeckii TaxID=1082345 RepID=A0A7W9EGE6_9SPHN|nr:Hsp33 family molecular chaperone HslO [Sphingobium boeckii]MBB5687035.1 molecular chaperone Hsp33 [Sphingobium boeckii]